MAKQRAQYPQKQMPPALKLKISAKAADKKAAASRNTG